MEQNTLIEKLALQTETLQEAFQILSASPNLKSMGRTFARVLRGSFIINEVYIFIKEPPAENWQLIFPEKYTGKIPDSYLIHADCLKINYHSSDDAAASVILPLPEKAGLAFVLGLKLDKTVFSDFDKVLLQILLQVFDSAYRAFLNQKKEKKLIFDLNEKIFQLNNLVDTGIELSSLKNSDMLYELALQQVCTITNSSSALLEVKNKKIPGSEVHFTFPPGLPAEEILNSKYKIDSSFEFRDKRYVLSLSEKETRGGVTSFDDLDVTLLKAIARQVSASIENEFLLKQSIEKERIEQELSVAASIQEQIIPKHLPKINGYKLAGKNIPSKEVGGDYFDVISLKNGKTVFIIADVAGKGISAALLVNTLNAALYSYLDFDLPLSELSDKLNKIIFNSSPPAQYITFFIAVLDPAAGELDMLNAGHNPVFILRNDGRLDKVEAGGVGLGMFDFGLPFNGEKTTLNIGDTLFLYTDGIPEAMDPDEELYSDEKMIRFFLDNANLPPEEFIPAIFSDVKKHTRNAPQSDDITALILRRD